MGNKQLILNSSLSTILLKCALAPSAGNYSSTEDFASCEDMYDTQQNLSSCQYKSGKFFDCTSSFSKPACKFAFFFHFLNMIFSVLTPAFSYPSSCLSEMLPVLSGLLRRKRLPLFIYSLNKL